MDLGSLYSLLHNKTVDLDPDTMRMMVSDFLGGVASNIFLPANRTLPSSTIL